MDCTDCVSMWDIVSAIALSVVCSGSLVMALNYYWDVKRDRVIMALQKSYAERNKMNKKL